MRSTVKDIFAGTVALFYPHICTGCGSDLVEEENLLCLRCINDLPYTGFAALANNPVEKFFWGRLPLAAAHSEFYFSKEFLIQQLIHRLKYKADTAIGYYLGELMGRSMLQSSRFSAVDALIPLPLYIDKEHKRGYNQAAIICNGMSSVMNIPVMTGYVNRRRFTETQTRKHRTERWENVKGSFVISNSAALQHKHVLLVDDVVTTGATLEACGQAILETGNIKLSVATLAYAAK